MRQGLGIGGGEQGAGMAGAELARLQQRLDGVRQLQQPQGIRNMRPALADLPGQILLAAGELVDQPAVALRLFQRREVVALDVLDDGELQHLAVGDLALQHRHLMELGDLGRAPAPLAGDDLMHAGPGWMNPDQERLQDAVAADRLCQGFELIGIEMPARLQRAGLELADGQMPLGTARPRRGRGAGIPQQRGEAAAEAALGLDAHALSLRWPGASPGASPAASPGASAGWWRRSNSPASWI